MTELAPQNGDAIRLLIDLEHAGACTPTALDLANVELTWERYVGIGALLGAIKRRTSWYLGDWLVEGEERFGEKMAQAADVTGLSPSTLVNYRWVCSRVPPVRRVEALSFGCHDAVAALGPRDQRSWLGKASREGWNRERLRAALRDAAVLPRAGRVALGEAQEQATLRIVDARNRLLEAAAPRDGGWWVPGDVWEAFVAA